MIVQTEELKHYSHFAPYFINGDATGLTDVEEEEADKFLADIKAVYGDSAEIIGCGDDEEFGIPEWGGLAGTVISYTIWFRFEELPESIWDLPKNMPYLNERY